MRNSGKDLEKSLLESLRQFQGPHPNATLLVACSGGADSIGLLRLCTGVAGEHGFSIAVGHVDHRLRGSRSRADAAFVRRLCKDLNVPYLEKVVNVKVYAHRHHLGVEAAARTCRYQALLAMAKKVKARAVLTAHTLEDQSETVLLNLLRGSGPAGLCGIWKICYFPKSKIPVVRPLLGIRRSRLRMYLQSLSQPHREDESNRSLRFLRNWVRHRLLPPLRRRNPQVDRRLAQLADILQAEESWRPWPRQQGRLDLGRFLRYPIAVQRRLLHRAVPVEPRFDAIESLRTRLTQLRFTPQISRAAHKPLSFLTVPGQNRGLPGGWDLTARVVRGRPQSFNQGPWIALLDWARVSGGRFAWRFARPGDRFRPLGMNGTKKISDFFCDEKVPPAVRSSVPLVEREEKPVWVVGFRVDDSVKVREETRQTLVLKAFKI